MSKFKLQDRFKFRCWLTHDKRYAKDINLFGFGEDNNSQEVEECEKGGNYTMYSPEEYILEQCTGLKDRKGNLIYEGDIVTKLYITPDGRITNETDRGFIKEITFFKGCFGIFGKTDFYPLIEYVDYHQGHYISNAGNVTIYDNCFLEVIGNIHENQELLKGDY